MKIKKKNYKWKKKKTMPQSKKKYQQENIIKNNKSADIFKSSS